MDEVALHSHDPQWLASFLASGKPDWMKPETWDYLVVADSRKQQEAAMLQLLTDQKQGLEQRNEALKTLRDSVVKLIVNGRIEGVKPASISDQEWQDLRLLEIALNRPQPPAPQPPPQ